MKDRLIKRQEVEQRTGLSRSSIYRDVKLGKFPLQIRIGARAVRWRLSEIEEYIRSRPRGSNSNGEADEEADEETE